MEVKARTLDGTFTESFLLVLPQGENRCLQFWVWKMMNFVLFLLMVSGSCIIFGGYPHVRFSNYTSGALA